MRATHAATVSRDCARVVNKWNEKHTDPVTALVMPHQQSAEMREYLELARRMKVRMMALPSSALVRAHAGVR